MALAEMTDEQLEKLPKYARGEVLRLRRQVDTLTRRIEEFPDSPKARVFADPYAPLTGGVKPRPVADFRDTVAFYLTPELKEGDAIHAMIRNNRELELSSQMGSIWMVPKASNLIIVGVNRH